MFELRAATQADAAAIAAIHVDGWKTTYRGILPDGLLDALRMEDRLPRWRGWIDGPGVHTLVACRDAGVIGFIRLCPARPVADPPPAYAEITHLYVDAQAHGTGAGRALIGRAMEIAREEGYRGVLLWVLEENHRARAFYASAGLRADGTLRTEPELLGNDAVEVRYALPFAPRSAAGVMHPPVGAATLHLLTGPWGAGKSTLVPHLARLLPEVVVFDWDALLPGLSAAAGKDAHRDPSTWNGLRAMWTAVVQAVLAGGRDVLLCGPARPDDFPPGTFDGPVRCAFLDCPDGVLADRLRGRGERERDLAGELADMAELRASGYHPLPAGNRDPHQVAADAAAWVCAVRAGHLSGTQA